jgi:hypothetical protein
MSSVHAAATSVFHTIVTESVVRSWRSGPRVSDTASRENSGGGLALEREAPATC